MGTRRYAVLWGKAASVDSIKRFLPSNYTARVIGPDVLVAGTDSAGWTLDDYVIPRLGSGLFYAKEVSAADAWPDSYHVEGPDPSVGLFGNAVAHQDCRWPDSDGAATMTEVAAVGQRVDGHGYEYVQVLVVLECTVCHDRAVFLDEQFGGPADDTV